MPCLSQTSGFNVPNYVRKIEDGEDTRENIEAVRLPVNQSPETEYRTTEAACNGHQDNFERTQTDPVYIASETVTNNNVIGLYGFLPDDDMTVWGKARCVLLQGFMMFLHFQHTAGPSMELYLSLDEEDLQYTGDCFIFVIAHLKDFFKLLPLLVSPKKFEQLFYTIDNYFIRGIEPTESDRKLVETYMNRSRKISQHLWIAYWTVQFTFFANTPPKPDIQEFYNLTQTENVKNMRRRSAIKNWFPFQALEFPYYELLAVYENVTMVIYFVFTTLMNTTILVLIIQATAQFALLAETLKTASHRVAEKLSNTGQNCMHHVSVYR
ncbi:hypothetical protein ANN_19254 [Periplaneta americana]|uniref:Uncharacterized protein n=1 Tax=Periplaneta americana TaxID=6978 RepID=A0ABQ8S9D5_PERAM|nr:hypothetical protein ANN_19254 [Periplaneta americana]